MDNISQICWCDHLDVRCDFLNVRVPTACIASPLTYLVVEEGKIKLLCGSCLRKGLKTRLYLRRFT